MVIDRSALILGVTGSFGSGCSTLAKALSGLGYKKIHLSSKIHNTWNATEQQKPIEQRRPSAPKKELQDIGNQLRKTDGPVVLARAAIDEADALAQDSLVVFDGIRNAAEVELLRQTFPNFVLIAVWCPMELRWERVKEEYGGMQNVFMEDDKRDHNEEVEHGQQVQICVDKADILIKNDSNMTQAAANRFLHDKIKEYVELLHGVTLRPPLQDEVGMAIAYTQSLRSLCLKRTVGAVITDNKGRVISTGYNENPEPLKPCISQFKYCYKDAQVQQQIQILVTKRPKCPLCDASITYDALGENYRCPGCGKSISIAYAPDRGMSRCTAIHAENMAIMNARESLRDAILYTSTFPCSQCARQITFAGIREVVYIEPYPDPDSKRYLEELAGIRVRVFEGVKARAYERVFGRVRAGNEKKFALPG
jgi:deoxycytidylate deaminase/dephospho-CoA kinase